MAARSGLASGTLITSIRKYAEFGSSSSGAFEHPASSSGERTDDEPALRAGMTVTVSIDTERVRGLPDFVPQGIADLRLPDFLRRALALDKGRRE